jgi:hypothetical protein
MCALQVFNQSTNDYINSLALFNYFFSFLNFILQSSGLHVLHKQGNHAYLHAVPGAGARQGAL